MEYTWLYSLDAELKARHHIGGMHMFELIVSSLESSGLLNGENGQKIQKCLKSFNEDCLKTFEIILTILNQNNLLLDHEKGQKHLRKIIYIISKLFENSVGIDSFVKILDVLSKAKLLQDTTGDAILANILKKLTRQIEFIEKDDQHILYFHKCLQYWIEITDILNSESLLIGCDGEIVLSNMFWLDDQDVAIWRILQNLQMITEENMRKLLSETPNRNKLKSIQLIHKIDMLSIEDKRRYIKEIMLSIDCEITDFFMALFIEVGFLEPQNVAAFMSHYNSSYSQLSLLYGAVGYFKRRGLDQESFGDILELNSQELKSLQEDNYHMSTKATEGGSLSTFSMFTIFKVKQSQRTLHKWLLDVGLTDKTERCIEINAIVDVLEKHWSLFSIEQRKSYLQNMLSCDFLVKINSVLYEMSQINLLTTTNELACLDAILHCVNVADTLQELLKTSLLRTQRRFENLEKVISHDYPAELSSAITICNQAGLLTNRKAQDNFNVIITSKDLTVFERFNNLDQDEAQANFDNDLLMKNDGSSAGPVASLK